MVDAGDLKDMQERLQGAAAETLASAVVKRYFAEDESEQQRVLQGVESALNDSATLVVVDGPDASMCVKRILGEA